MRYFTRALGESDLGRKDMLHDIATEELSHLEVIGNIVVMLNKGVKARWRKAPRPATSERGFPDARLAERTASDTTEDPTTGADLGAGPGAGRTKPIEGRTLLLESKPGSKKKK